MDGIEKTNPTKPLHIYPQPHRSISEPLGIDGGLTSSFSMELALTIIDTLFNFLWFFLSIDYMSIHYNTQHLAQLNPAHFTTNYIYL